MLLHCILFYLTLMAYMRCWLNGNVCPTKTVIVNYFSNSETHDNLYVKGVSYSYEFTEASLDSTVPSSPTEL